ncbi:ATP-grasp domain-containing protein [Actinokineospora bangkokensis]|uniref:DabC n=1 Tax=Actinokineospora bangkokensis TaxID=1193682 RepID=A0A1Q9LRJ4_9PSEU|nr:ATP-grasp domain-containing protein [Actinokineospora bangkokensis]OLR94649.1 DabC [Actinokineospora bangkokensis]
MTELLLVGVGMMGRPYVAAAKRLGLSVHAVESRERAEALTGEVDRVTPVDGDSDEAWVAAAAAAAAASRPDGVVAFAEPHVLAAALVADQLGLPGPSLRAAVLSRNKALQRGRFAAEGVRQPEHLVVARLAEALPWARPRFPVVVKAVRESGSLGVELVADEAGFADAVARRAHETPLLVEVAVDGPEYSWEALVRGGRVQLANLTAKETTGPPGFVETGHRTAAVLPAAEAAAVDELAAGVLRGLGMRDGVVHLEFRCSSSGPMLMEVAVRTPGDYILEMLGHSHGVDWFEAVVRLAVGLPLVDPPQRRATPAGGWFPLLDPGVVTAIEGLDEVRAHPAVVRAGVLAQVGDTVPPVVSSAQRRVFVLFAAEDEDRLAEARAFAERTLRVRTSPV